MKRSNDDMRPGEAIRRLRAFRAERQDRIDKPINRREAKAPQQVRIIEGLRDDYRRDQMAIDAAIKLLRRERKSLSAECPHKGAKTTVSDEAMK
jgi:hypothetical protein